MPVVPWLSGAHPAFVLGGVPWTNGEALPLIGDDETPPECMVVTHLRTVAEPWHLDLRLVRTADSKVLGTLAAEFPMAQPGPALDKLAGELLSLLTRETGFERLSPPELYRVPAGASFPYYLLRLEQLLAVRCSGMDEASHGTLSGERDILDGNLQLCLAEPDNVVVRLVLAETLRRMRKVRPAAVDEVRDKIRLLQREKPLPMPTHDVIERMLLEVYR